MSVCFSRQPILDEAQKTAGYELLFRSGLTNYSDGSDQDQESVRIFHDGVMEVGLETLVGTSHAFLNVDRQALVDRLYTVLPHDKVVLGLRGDVEPDAAVMAACEELKSEGYRLALDDFALDARSEPLIKIADYVKVDFLSTQLEEQRAFAEKLSGQPVKLLAGNVDTSEQFETAESLGYEYFQGFFFCQPKLLAKGKIPQFKVNYLRFLQETQRDTIDLGRLEQIIKQDLSLSVKLLRVLNSASSGLSQEVTSLKRALLLLGEDRLRKWASVVVLTGLGEDQPSELAVTGLIRAQFCEFLSAASSASGPRLEYFLTGMLSILDALMGQPMEQALSDLLVPEPVQQALLGESNAQRSVLDLVLAYERGEWAQIARLAEAIGLAGPDITNAYGDAVSWANDVFAAAG